MVAAKARKFQDPPRCNTIQQFWDALPLWEQLGREVTLGGYATPDWSARAQSLDKLVPDELLHTIVVFARMGKGADGARPWRHSSAAHRWCTCDPMRQG